MSLEEIQENIERLYISMENDLLLNIADKLSRGKPMEIDKWDLSTNSPILGSGGVNEWQLERLKELDGLNEKNAKIVAKYSGKTVEEVNRVFDKAREIGTEVDKDILSAGIKAGILNEVNPIVENTKLKSIMRSASKTVLNTFNQQNNSLIASAGREYVDIINKVSTEVLAGTKTTIKAMQEAVSKLSEKGLTGFVAKNGARWSPEAYTKMVLRANTQNAINQVQEERLTARGGDYVEISQHVGARPLCSQDQGQIFSLSGNTEPIEDGKGRKIEVRAWSSSTYGKPAGILGINCRHSRYSFIPNVSVYRSEPIDKEENDKAYKERQQQRQYERNIRNKKREIEMLKVTGAEEDYIKLKRNQLSDYRKEYLGFLDKTGRTRVSGNEWIGTNNISSIKKTKSINQLTNWRKNQEKKERQQKIIKESIIGKFDIQKYTSNIVTTTKDVILLPERKQHITERHPDVKEYIENVPEILKQPDMVLKENKRQDTFWLVKKIGENVKVTIKLNTNNQKDYKNSIIQMQKMRESEIKRNIRNEKVQVLFDKTKEK